MVVFFYLRLLIIKMLETLFLALISLGPQPLCTAVIY